MKTLLLLIVFCFSIVANGQKKIDSLLNELKRHPEEDTIRFLLLKTLAFQYSTVDAKKGLVAADSAIALAKKLNSIVRIAGAYSNKATNLHKLGRDSEALALYRIAVNMHLSVDNKKGAANAYFNMAYICFDISNYAMAVSYQLKALALYKELNMIVDEADTYNSIADNYMRLDDYSSALKYFMLALNIYQQQKMEQNEAMVLSNIGMTYHALSDSSKSLLYYRQALQIDEKNDNKENLAHDYQHIGILYDEANKFDTALNYYSKSLQLNSELKDERQVADNLVNIASTYNKMKDYRHAIININAALELYNIHTDKYNTAALLNEKGKMYADCPSSFLKDQHIKISDRYTAALHYQQLGLQLAKEIRSYSLIASILEDISNTFKASGAYNNALDAYKQAIAWRDSIFTDDQKKQITRLEMQYEFEKKEALNKALTDKKEALSANEIAKQKLIRNIIIYSALLLIIVTVIALVFYKKKKDAIAQKKEADFKIQVAETEMKALRAQMNPHFIFNSLNSIADYIDKHETQVASEFTAKFAKLMRMVLQNSEHKQIPLEDDLKALELYMQLECFRLKNKFLYTIKINEEIDTKNTMVPPLILQPFVENSIWHGISKKNGDGYIHVFIQQKGSMLSCVVEDGGVGINNNLQQQNGNISLGMRITKDRIDIINKLNSANAAVVVANNNNGVTAEILLPLQLNF